MLPQVERVRVDGAVGRALDRIYTLLTAVSQVPMLDGVLISDVPLVSTGFSSVGHRLSRRPRGYLVISQDASASVYEDKSLRDERNIALRSSATVNVDLWVF